MATGRTALSHKHAVCKIHGFQLSTKPHTNDSCRAQQRDKKQQAGSSQPPQGFAAQGAGQMASWPAGPVYAPMPGTASMPYYPTAYKPASVGYSPMLPPTAYVGQGSQLPQQTPKATATGFQKRGGAGKGKQQQQQGQRCNVCGYSGQHPAACYCLEPYTTPQGSAFAREGPSAATLATGVLQYIRNCVCLGMQPQLGKCGNRTQELKMLGILTPNDVGSCHMLMAGSSPIYIASIKLQAAESYSDA
eukprot:gene8102-8295_t